VANVDADPYREILAGMRDGKLYVFHVTEPLRRVPFSAARHHSGPAVGDIDLDGRMEIVFGSSNGKVWRCAPISLKPPGSPSRSPRRRLDSSPAWET